MTSRWQFLTSLIDCLLSQSSVSARSLRLQAEFSESCITTEGYLPMTFRIATNQKITLHLTATDKAQRPAPIENVTWSLMNDFEDLATINPNGMSATIIAHGEAGTVEGEVRADSRIGEGENILVGAFIIEIVPLEASHLIITADEPIDIAAASDPQPEPEPEPEPIS
ncbi:MAG: hypothetical protein ABTR07_12400 [Candidatus Competibacter denitrificans]